MLVLHSCRMQIMAKLKSLRSKCRRIVFIYLFLNTFQVAFLFLVCRHADLLLTRRLLPWTLCRMKYDRFIPPKYIQAQKTIHWPQFFCFFGGVKK